MRPLIAVTTTIDPSETAREHYRVPQVLLGTPYVAAVERVGCTPLMLTPAHCDESVSDVLDIAHGLMLTGGEDIDPALYGQERHPRLMQTCRARDDAELSILRQALERDLPVLAICRGLQLVNVAFGGTLYQDIPTQLGGDLTHEQNAPVNDRWHDARVDPDSLLGQVLGVHDLHINSFHHQAIEQLAEGLKANAWAEDGLIEGAESPSHRWLLGVQWHPERGEAEVLRDRREPDRRLFWAFAKEAGEYAREREGLSSEAPEYHSTEDGCAR